MAVCLSVCLCSVMSHTKFMKTIRNLFLIESTLFKVIRHHVAVNFGTYLYLVINVVHF